MSAKKFLEKVAALAISIVIFFTLGELITRLYLRNHVVYDIEMTKYGLAAKMDVDDPAISHMHKPNVDIHLMNVNVHINSDGFRDEERTLAKGRKYRIIFLGDSITFGWGVGREDAFPYILEKELNKISPTEILNFGTGNYNTEQEVGIFLKKGLKYDPDKVVIFYFINDAELTPKKSKLWFLGHSRMVSFYWSKFQSIRSRLSPSKGYKEYYSNLYTDKNPGWQNTKKSFLQIKNVCDEKKIAFQVVILPELHDLSHYPFKKEQDVVEAFLKENNIEYLDLTQYFEGYKRSEELWVSNDDAHPNTLAHRLIAKYIYDFIRNDLTPSPEGTE
ncbi:MAG: SGNH/GDSL hydrolase family protein [Candidatus Omnitrophota bacterium]